MSNALCMYDYTISTDIYNIQELKGILNKWCARWAFQKEVGKKNGYFHYQCRISFKRDHRIRWKTLLKLKPPRIRWSGQGGCTPTSNPSFYAGNEFYVMKKETRVLGPWTDRDEEKVWTPQMQIFSKWPLRIFQRDVIEESKKFCMRSINLIYDQKGGCGKSLLAEYMEYIGIAEEIPPYRMMDDIFQWVCKRPTKECYIVDMPRGMKKDKLADFYSGIEVVKNGVAFDKRYTPVKKRFARPRIFVFTNELPNLLLMTKDRWIVWTIRPNFGYEISHTWEDGKTGQVINPLGGGKPPVTRFAPGD